MSTNMPLAFTELLAGGLLFMAGYKGATLSQVVRGETGAAEPFAGGSASSTTGSPGDIDAAASGRSAGVTDEVPIGQTPARVQAAIQRASELAAAGIPYTWGGGHSTGALTAAVAALKHMGLDCSGFVSNVLGPAGAQVVNSPQTTQTIAGLSNVTPGEGEYITIYDRNSGAANEEHVIIDLDGHFYESGGNSIYNPSGGVSALTPAEAQGELSGGGFNPYHPIGL